ncbi:hypothetical protein [Nitrososphaera sp.]|uniref:hypothetical protein n=1 Tax=Nitrososphaera sp. TaxID=1971748 RepID=UPI00307E9107
MAKPANTVTPATVAAITVLICGMLSIEPIANDRPDATALSGTHLVKASSVLLFIGLSCSLE